MLKNLLSNILASEPIVRSLRHRVLSRRCVVLMYHEVAEDDVEIEAWTVVRKSTFLRQMEYVRRHFEIVSLERAISESGPAQTGSRPWAVVTFDDGDRGNAEVLLPVVRELGLPVTIFVATRHVVDQKTFWFDTAINALQTVDPVRIDLSRQGLGSYEVNAARGAGNWTAIQRLLTDLKRLSPDAREAVVATMLDRLSTNTTSRQWRLAPLNCDSLLDLAACPYVTIGAHSHCHNILTQIDPVEARRSIATSKQLLESWTGKEVWSFAYPNGDYDERITGMVMDLGFRCAFATGERLWSEGDSLFAIPRVGVGRYDSMATFRLCLLGGVKNVAETVIRGAASRSHVRQPGPRERRA